MHRRRVKWPRAAAGRNLRAVAGPVALGLCLWVGFPTVTAWQDMTSMIAGQERASARWGAFVERAAAGSVQSADMAFAIEETGMVSGAGISAPGIGTVAFRGKAVRPDTPDEDRVMRAEKGARLVRIAPVTPPKAFTAGSIFERTSSLLMRPALNSGLEMAFARPGIKGKEIEIAAAFHVNGSMQEEPGVPSFLASLVNNEHADVLATAYAPAEPDYARTSPFESLLRPGDAAAGRFIPPLEPGDHSWMERPLPAVVFSKAEQACLANAVYFEARSESLRGQAAVAQVVLNRVRNPAYPKTICGVVYQNDDWHGRCQFSFACDGKRDVVADRHAYKIAQDVALAVTAGKIFLPEVASSTHYHATYVRPRWAPFMQKMKKIGLHVFYRTYGGGWS